MGKKQSNLERAYESGINRESERIKQKIDSDVSRNLRHQVNGLSAFDLSRLGITINQFEKYVQGEPKGTKGFPFL